MLRLVPDIDEEYPSSKSDSSDQEDEKLDFLHNIQSQQPPSLTSVLSSQSASFIKATAGLNLCNNNNSSSTSGANYSGLIIDGGGLSDVNETPTVNSEKQHIFSNSIGGNGMERKRRKLPEIPKVKKSKFKGNVKKWSVVCTCSS